MSYKRTFLHDLPWLGREGEGMHSSFLKITVWLLLFFLSLFSRIHGNYGLNKIVCVRHLFLSFLRNFILLKGYSKPSSYGLMAKSALYLKCLEGSNNSLATFLCANPSNKRFNDLLNQMVCPSKGRINPYWQLNSSWTTSNVGHINNEEGKTRWYKFLFLMLNLLEKAISTTKLLRLVYCCCCYVQLHLVLRKKKQCAP